jgi:biotin carboxylase
MRLLILAAGFRFQYRVLRCAAATGAEVTVIGDPTARGLARSRYCARFIPSAAALTLEHADALVEQINRVIEAHAIDRVLPGDGPTTRLLGGLQQRLRAPCFPVPSPQVFDQLNDKAEFAKLCATLELPHPASRRVTKDELIDLHQRGALRLPAIVKPTALHGRLGVVKLEPTTAAEVIARIDYAPILLQDFIDGEDVCISLFCRGGAVLAELAYVRRRARFHHLQVPELSAGARRIARHFAYDGVLAFDGRLTPDGRFGGFIECNPRFWYNMDVAMIAGLNFVALGLAPETPADGRVRRVIDKSVRLPKALLAAAATPWRWCRDDFRMLSYALRDPVPLALIESGLDPH